MCIRKVRKYDLFGVKQLAEEWKWAAIIWRILDHAFVVGSFAASILVVFISTDTEITRIQITALSSIAAVLTLMGFACKPTKYMKNYRKAFQLLNHALVTHTSKDGVFSDDEDAWKDVINAIKLGEAYIGKTYDVDLENEDKNI